MSPPIYFKLRTEYPNNDNAYWENFTGVDVRHKIFIFQFWLIFSYLKFLFEQLNYASYFFKLGLIGEHESKSHELRNQSIKVPTTNI